MNNLHREFVRLGRERNRITYQLLALLPKINEQKIYQQAGYANIFDYSARIAGLSPGVVKKALKLEEKLANLPHLQKTIETQGINKVGIVAGLATTENEKELAEKVENMSKPALQEYSKELRGKITVSWQVELDRQMMFMFMKLKNKLGKNLSNKECLRKILKEMQGQIGEKSEPQRQNEKSAGHVEEKAEPQRQAQKPVKIPGDLAKQQVVKKPSRYIPVSIKKTIADHCVHPGCWRPAEIIHHPERFSQNPHHQNLKPLCRAHHEFAHNGISESMQIADHQYRQYRQTALV